MSLTRHIDPEQVLESLRKHSNDGHKYRGHIRAATSSTTPYSTRYASREEISKYRIPKNGAPADAVHQMLKDELDLDGKPNLNLARYL
jgi:glutamate decarboxylase